MKSYDTPIIIISAGRSGTKMLRSILTSHPELCCFPHEINYIWRYGNAQLSSDELNFTHVRPDVIRYIHKRFRILSEKNNGRRVVEKTCANSLRVEFVHTIFPKAFFIHLIRDGRAVAESARRCWRSRPTTRYIIEKARWLPLRDIPLYGIRYLRYQFARTRSRERAQASWGPRFNGLDKLVKEKTLIEVCGIQWKACLQAAESGIRRLPPESTVTLRYEDIVKDAQRAVKKIFHMLNLDLEPEYLQFVQNEVHSMNLNKWQESLSPEDLQLLIPHIEPELLSQGYEI